MTTNVTGPTIPPRTSLELAYKALDRALDAFARKGPYMATGHAIDAAMRATAPFLTPEDEKSYERIEPADRVALLAHVLAREERKRGAL